MWKYNSIKGFFKKRYCSFDTETTGLHTYRGDKVFSYCIGHENGEVEVRRIDRAGSKEQNIRRLREFWDDTSIGKVGHNLKFDMGFIINEGINVPRETEIHDTMIMSQLLRNLAPSHSLDYLAWEFGKWPRDLDVEVAKAGKAFGGYQNIPESLMNPYQESDGQRTMLLFQLWYKQIMSDVKLSLDYFNEMDLLWVVLKMEKQGIHLCKQQTENLIIWLENEIEKVTNETFYTYGEYINLNSDDQVARLLYKRLKLPIFAYTKDSHKPATDKDTLLMLRKDYPNQAIDLVFRQRSYTRGLSIIRDYLEFSDEKGIIHPNIKQNVAKTGRLSSEFPNLMNVAKEEVEKNPYPVPARKCFSILDRDHLLDFSDYAGIELRLISEVSECHKMINIFKSGESPHTFAAKIFYGPRVPPEMQFISKKETPKLYGSAKNAHFALPYACALPQFANTLNLTIAQARSGFEEYKRIFPEIANIYSVISDRVMDKGYVETPFGRKLYVPLDKAYSGLNYLIQGTAAGILKRALVRLDSYIESNWKGQMSLVISIHDEIVRNSLRDLLPQRKRILSEIGEVMTTMPEITVPLEVEHKSTYSTWNEAKEVRF
jgi:DNA polymerase-1